MNEELEDRLFNWFADFMDSGIMVDFGNIQDVSKRDRLDSEFMELLKDVTTIKKLREIDSDERKSNIRKKIDEFYKIIKG